ncbi:unnamed protein product [Arctogadus glacialis]
MDLTAVVPSVYHPDQQITSQPPNLCISNQRLRDVLLASEPGAKCQLQQDDITALLCHPNCHRNIPFRQRLRGAVDQSGPSALRSPGSCNVFMPLTSCPLQLPLQEIHPQRVFERLRRSDICTTTIPIHQHHHHPHPLPPTPPSTAPPPSPSTPTNTTSTLTITTAIHSMAFSTTTITSTHQHLHPYHQPNSTPASACQTDTPDTS